MKKFEITKEQILELANESSFTKATLNKMFPQAFESELEVGRWYKNNDSGWRKSIAFVVNLTPDDFNDFNGYGFDMNGDWLDCQDGWGSNDWTLATDKEVETALIAEAKKRGFKEGCFYNWKDMKKCKAEGVLKMGWSTEYDLYFQASSGFVFKNGKWAEIISEPLTLEQRIERIEEQLKIKK